VLEQTYSNCTWQNETLGAAKGTAHADKNDMVNLGLKLGLFGYPEEAAVNGDKIHKTALQYIENHDHERFVCNFGILSKDNYLLREGDRGSWYKNQPYLIGLLPAKGIPMLWQGQYYFYNHYDNYISKNVLLFSREHNGSFSLVGLKS